MRNRLIMICNKENFNTKSKKNRSIPVSDNLNSILVNHMKIGSNIVALYDESNYLFSSKNNARLNRDFLSCKFRRILRRLNIKGCFHALRHYFISTLIKSGVNIHYVKEIAGHGNIKTTMGYVHIGTNDLREAMNKINVG